MEIDDMKLESVLNLARSKIMQVRLPVAIVGQILGQTFGYKNMSGVPAIHHALADVDCRPSNIHLVIEINHLVDRATVNSHPQLDVGLIAQRLADFERAADWLFRAAEKKQHHAVPSGQTNQFSTGFRIPKTLCSANNSIELLHQLDLLVDQEFRVSNNVDEQKMCDLEREIRFIPSR